VTQQNTVDKVTLRSNHDQLVVTFVDLWTKQRGKVLNHTHENIPRFSPSFLLAMFLERGQTHPA
jgi:hypothetical protein